MCTPDPHRGYGKLETINLCLFDFSFSFIKKKELSRRIAVYAIITPYWLAYILVLTLPEDTFNSKMSNGYLQLSNKDVILKVSQLYLQLWGLSLMSILKTKNFTGSIFPYQVMCKLYISLDLSLSFTVH